MLTRIVLVCLLAVAVGCDAGRSRVALGECARGWWTGLSQSCVVACIAQPPPAACGHSDCAQVPVLRLEGEQFARGTIAISVEAGALQFLGAVLEGPYSAAGNTITLDGAAATAACDAGSLTIGGVVYHRACAALSSSLERSAHDGWSPQPVTACK